MGTASQLDDAITVIRAAFSDGADDNTKGQGVHVLQTMLTALQGARSAAGADTDPAPATPPSGAPGASAAPAPAIPTPKTPPPNLLDFVIYTLKEQLDDEDRAAVDAEQSAGFSVPFINI